MVYTCCATVWPLGGIHLNSAVVCEKCRRPVSARSGRPFIRARSSTIPFNCRCPAESAADSPAAEFCTSRPLCSPSPVPIVRNLRVPWWVRFARVQTLRRAIEYHAAQLVSLPRSLNLDHDDDVVIEAEKCSYFRAREQRPFGPVRSSDELLLFSAPGVRRRGFAAHQE